MTTADQPGEARRESFLEVAQREMIAFENKERDFRQRARQEELAQLRLASIPSELH